MSIQIKPLDLFLRYLNYHL